MDSRSHYDYRRQGEYHPTNPGYSLHAADGNPHEPSRGADEGRRVHRHPYLEERPTRGSTSVDLSYPSQEEYCEFWSALLNWMDSQGADEKLLSVWARQRAQTLDDAHPSARGDEYSVPGMYDRPFNPLPRRIAA